MKVTSLELSKKLAEIGFEAETEFYWAETGKRRIQLEYIEFEVGAFYQEWKYTKAYDLETILEVLPSAIELNNYYPDSLSVGKEYLGYQLYDPYCGNIDDVTRPNEKFWCVKLNIESLASTAAKLLLKLHEAKLIKFEE